MRIAVFCPNLIGDTVMATPTFRAIRRGFPGAEVAAVIKPHVAPTLDGTNWFDEWIRFDPRSRIREERSWSALGRLRGGRFDLAVLLPNSVRSAGMAWLAGIPRRVGYANHGRSILLTDHLHHPRDEKGRRLPVPIVESYLNLACQLGCPVDSIRLELATTPRRRGRRGSGPGGSGIVSRRARGLLEYRGSLRPGEELADLPFRRACPPTGRRARSTHPGSLRSQRAGRRTGDRSFRGAIPGLSAWPIRSWGSV